MAFHNYPKVDPGLSLLGKQLWNIPVVKGNAQFKTGNPGLGYLQQTFAQPELITYMDLAFIQAGNGQVLAKSTGFKIGIIQYRYPIGIVIPGETVDRFVSATMILQIRLSVPFKIIFTCKDGTWDGLFKDTGGDLLAIVFDGFNGGDIYRG